MDNSDYIYTPAGKKRVKALADQMTRSHGICKRQSLELARQEVKDWAFRFSPEGLRASILAMGK